MKIVLVPALMLLLFSQTFSKWMIVVEYRLNRDFITRTLCVNKAKPILKCKGRCQMMKKIAGEEKQNSSNEKNIPKIKIQELVFTDQMNTPVLPSPRVADHSFNESSSFFKESKTGNSVFHPPAVA